MRQPNLSFLADPRLQHVMGALEEAGFEALVVGGAARDGLLGQTPKDIDLATNAHPDRVGAVLSAAGADMRPTGLAHGTWTAMVGGEGFEITTYRRDVSTDGRRATVAFASSFEEDAQRRDFTINALGLTRKGEARDPTGEGLDDLDRRRVRFVGDGATRCAEDSLRALRLFRFQGRLGAWPMDQGAVNAAAGADLSGLSGERVWSEVKGILSAPQGARAAETMAQVGIWNKILPRTSLDTEALQSVARREDEAGLTPSWAARIHALTGRDRLPWPVSGAEARHLTLLAKHQSLRGDALVGAAASGSASVGRDLWVLGKTAIPEGGVETTATRGAEAILPVSAADFLAQGMRPGPLLGQALSAARQAWLDSGLRAERHNLLTNCPAKQKQGRTGEREME